MKDGKLLRFSHVTKLYGNVIGVNDIDLTLPGGAYGLLGPNGSGKSTMLNLILGQLNPTIGSLRVFGEPPHNNQRLLGRIGYCPSNEGLYANVSAFEWVRYLMELHGMRRNDAKRATERALERVGMTYAMHREISGYSRGMRQRTKLAQAIAHEPALLILDEPFNGLDPIARNDITLLLQDWINQGRSLLMASHILHELECITDSFLLICGGRLLASGTSQEVRAMLVDLPNEILLRTSTPNELAQRMIRLGLVDSVKITDTRVAVATRSPIQLLSYLPAWGSDAQIDIQEVQSADESLQSLFSNLLRIHRGEL